MHDIKWIRENPEAFDRGLARRNLAPLAAELLALDAETRQVRTETQGMQQRRNEASKQVGQIKRDGGDASDLMAEVAAIKDAMQAGEARERELTEDLQHRLCIIPNTLDEDVPDGPDESANVEVRRHGEPGPVDSSAKEHFEIGEALGQMDFEIAAKMSGSRFSMLTGGIARMERALGEFMLDLHTEEFGYTEVSSPMLVREEALFGTGQLPKFADDLFRTTGDHWLIPTAEVTLTNIAADRILDITDLPLRFTARTGCFRSEAGAAGRDTRGILRQHQFTKVELVSIAHPDKSREEHERMTSAAEEVLKRLELPFRTVVLASGDTGFGARKTYDIEVWLPGQGTYREISSCSNCGDFQARRMKARFREDGAKGTQFVHTLNGSGVAVGRALIAVLENYQQPDGSVAVPAVLQPYMRGARKIAAA
ncbi:MAG: serine--tRNA ligase [Rhodospirillales bacterium]